MNHELTPPGDFPRQAYTGADALAAQIKLWEFLGRRVHAYTMGESSSVRTETAQALFASACYVLGLDMSRPAPPATLLDWDLDARFRAGIAVIEEKLKTAGTLWQAACLGVPGIENISLHTTLKSIGSFSKRYFYRDFAHRIPCDIDYQLCHPVSDALLGVDYILGYLRHLLIEQDLLRRFDPALCIGLLDAYCPDYKGLLINLYRPVATNAIGLALVDGDVLGLRITPLQQSAIGKMLAPLPKGPAVAALQAAASAACTALAIGQPEARRYLQALAEALYPPIGALLPRGSLAGIFLSF